MSFSLGANEITWEEIKYDEDQQFSLKLQRLRVPKSVTFQPELKFAKLYLHKVFQPVSSGYHFSLVKGTEISALLR